MVHITISGPPGSGTTTLVEKLSNHFSWSSINGGKIFRDEAANRGLDLETFGRLCADDLSVDRELDDELQRILSDVEGPEIVESRLAGRWAYQLGIDCVRIWIAVSEEERARRIVIREGGEIESRLVEARQRDAVDHARFQELYGFDESDREQYTHVIFSDNMTVDDVFIETLSILEGRGIVNV